MLLVSFWTRGKPKLTPSILQAIVSKKVGMVSDSNDTLPQKVVLKRLFNYSQKRIKAQGSYGILLYQG